MSVDVRPWTAVRFCLPPLTRLMGPSPVNFSFASLPSLTRTPPPLPSFLFLLPFTPPHEHTRLITFTMAFILIPGLVTIAGKGLVLAAPYVASGFVTRGLWGGFSDSRQGRLHSMKKLVIFLLKFLIDGSRARAAPAGGGRRGRRPRQERAADESARACCTAGIRVNFL